MATRAEVARNRAEREAQRTKPKKRRRSPAVAKAVRARKRAEAAQLTSGRFAGGVTAARNVKLDRGEHETHDLEDSASGRPSRKSTRKSAHRIKADSQLRRKAVRRARSPASRAATRAGA